MELFDCGAFTPAGSPHLAQIMTAILAKVTAIEKRGDQYQVIVQISPKYRGSFNTLAFGEIKPHSGSLKDGRLDLIYHWPNHRRSVSALDSSLMEEKRRGHISFVGLPVQPMRSMPLALSCDLVRKKLTLLAVITPSVCCRSALSAPANC